MNIAPLGTVWVCYACGESKRDRASFQTEWCRRYSTLCITSTIERGPSGRIVRAQAVEQQQGK